MEVLNYASWSLDWILAVYDIRVILQDHRDIQHTVNDKSMQLVLIMNSLRIQVKLKYIKIPTTHIALSHREKSGLLKVLEFDQSMMNPSHDSLSFVLVGECGDYSAPTFEDLVGDWGAELHFNSSPSSVLSGWEICLLGMGIGCKERGGCHSSTSSQTFKYWGCSETYDKSPANHGTSWGKFMSACIYLIE